MEQGAQIAINNILTNAQATALSKNEVKQLDTDKPEQSTSVDYYGAAFYICQQRNAKTIGFYAPMENVKKLASNAGIEFDSKAVENVEVILPFFAGGC